MSEAGGLLVIGVVLAASFVVAWPIAWLSEVILRRLDRFAVPAAVAATAGCAFGVLAVAVTTGAFPALVALGRSVG